MVDLHAPAVLVRRMNIATTRGQGKTLSLPNILTYARIAAIPVVVGCVFAQSILDGPLWLRWVALAVDRKSTRLNSSHSQISYAVFCLKKKRTTARSDGITYSLCCRSTGAASTSLQSTATLYPMRVDCTRSLSKRGAVSSRTRLSCAWP